MRNLRLILALVLVPAALWAQGSTFSNHWLDQLPITTNATFTPTRQDQWRGGCGAFSVLGTFDSATVTFEASFDDVNFFTVNDTGGAPIAPTAAAENVQFCLPFAYIRVTIAGGGGSLSITQMGVAAMGDTVALWLGTGGTLQLVQSDDDANPALCFNGSGTCDTGINESPVGSLAFSFTGVNRFTMSSVGFLSHLGTGFQLRRVGSTATVPTIIPNQASTNTGWGGVSGELSADIVGVEAVNIRGDLLAAHLGNIGANPPATCRAGTTFIDTDTSDDTNCVTAANGATCNCTAADTWVSFN